MEAQRQRSGFPYWLITRRVPGRGDRELEVYSLEMQRGRLLPVFISEDDAERFLENLSVTALGEDPGDRWWIRRSGAGELISLLSGSAFSAGACAGVERVVVDPPADLPGTLSRNGSSEPIGESRGCFLERLMGRGRPWFENKEQGGNRAGASRNGGGSNQSNSQSAAEKAYAPGSDGDELPEEAPKPSATER